MEIKKLDSRIIQELRFHLFPLIGFDIITGYNIYEKPYRSKAPFQVSYLHNELKKGKRHRRRLFEVIEEFGEGRLLKNISFERIDRNTSYKLEEGWKAAEYYDVWVRRLSEE